MKYKLYGLYSGDELVFVGRIRDTTEDWCDIFNYHLHILEQDRPHQNPMYKYMRDRVKQGHQVHIYPFSLLENMPDWKEEELERIRQGIVYALCPMGNWKEWGEKDLIEEEVV